MIRKVKGGYKVYSESGKLLSKTLPSKSQAQTRLRQVHYYSNKK